MNNFPTWLADAVFYEIYPQSFQDSNGDGIGDINGMIARLDYIKELGCNAVWVNSWYDSPFGDAGYDVRDYKKIAPRYGTNEDAKRFFDEAHRRGMHVLIDLVPGHTAIDHEWFKTSMRADKNEYSDRYIWTNSIWEGGGEYATLRGISDRDGCAVVNFFSHQPALNYGYAHPDRPWKISSDSPAALSTREAMKDVMRFWLDLGLTASVSIWRRVSSKRMTSDIPRTFACGRISAPFSKKNIRTAPWSRSGASPKSPLRAVFTWISCCTSVRPRILRSFAEKRPSSQKRGKAISRLS